MHNAIKIAIGVNTTWIPRSFSARPNVEFGPYRTRIITPVTSVGMARGRSMIVASTRLPGNRYRTITHASTVPITALISAAAVAVHSVNQIASTAPGADIAVWNAVSPSPNPLEMTASTGRTTSRPR